MEKSGIDPIEVRIHQGGYYSTLLGVDVAWEMPTIRQGLSGRESLDKDSGMLFMMAQAQGKTGNWTFNMKNCYIPLDLIFIDSSWLIVGIVHSAPPGSIYGFGIGMHSAFVLEVNGGWSKKAGIKNGDRVEFLGLGG